MFEIKSYDTNFIILKRDFFIFFFEKILMGHFREKKNFFYLIIF